VAWHPSNQALIVPAIIQSRFFGMFGCILYFCHYQLLEKQINDATTIWWSRWSVCICLVDDLAMAMVVGRGPRYLIHVCCWKWELLLWTQGQSISRKQSMLLNPLITIQPLITHYAVTTKDPEGVRHCLHILCSTPSTDWWDQWVSRLVYNTSMQCNNYWDKPKMM
jgi:hypothetical protein